MTLEELLRERAELVPDRVAMKPRRKKRGPKSGGLEQMPCVYDPAAVAANQQFDCRRLRA
jgi:hypothetical protein